MGLKTYKASGVAMTALKRLIGLKLRVTGGENLSDRPTLYVVNHFTRFETFIIPYVIYHQTRAQVRSLATHSIFKGIFARYWNALGVMSVRDPRRNRTIVGELMTGRHDWVIYPEGGLIKNKKTVRGGRLRLERPDREGPPHTGAAIMALKAEIYKRRYLDACAENDRDRMSIYEEHFGIDGPEDLDPKSTVVVPVSVTYHGMRPAPTLLNRVARWLDSDIDPRFEEELIVEGGILFGDSEISVHFGKPIEVADFLNRATHLMRRVLGLFSDERPADVFIRGEARRLTARAMRSIYSSLEVNVEHLFCYGLRSVRRSVVPIEEFHRAIYLAAVELRACDDVRLHPDLHNGIAGMLCDGPFPPIDRIIELTQREGLVRIEDGHYHIDHDAITLPHDFHSVRLKRMAGVIANELEPIRAATNAVRRAVNLSPSQLRARLARTILETEQLGFQREYASWSGPDARPPATYGEPFLLESRDADVGVVLVHGYLACPEEVRPLAEHLHARGMTVFVPRLFGHGTAPRHLADVSWADWMESALEGLTLIRQLCRRTVVGGFSLGGVLSLLAAARNRDAVDAILCINAPVRLCDRRVRLIPALLRLHGVMRRLGLRDDPEPWHNDTESPGVNYEMHYLSAVRELQRAVRTCRRALPSVTPPTLVVQSTGDPVVHPDSGRRLVRSLGAGIKTLREPVMDRHVIVRGEGSENVFAIVTDFLDEVLGTEPVDEPPRPRRLWPSRVAQTPLRPIQGTADPAPANLDTDPPSATAE